MMTKHDKSYKINRVKTGLGIMAVATFLTHGKIVSAQETDIKNVDEVYNQPVDDNIVSDTEDFSRLEENTHINEVNHSEVSHDSEANENSVDDEAVRYVEPDEHLNNEQSLTRRPRFVPDFEDIDSPPYEFGPDGVIPPHDVPSPYHKDLLSDNVHSHRGVGVGAKFVSGVRREDGSVEMTYDVSVAGVHSSDHVQTADVFTFTLPKFAKDVQFTLIGTRDKQGKPVDVNMKLDIVKTGANARGIPSAEEVTRLYEQGIDRLSGVVVEDEDGVDGAKLSHKTSDRPGESKVKQYTLVSTISSHGDDGDAWTETSPIGIRVTFTVSKEQMEKTPYIPLDVRGMWKRSQVPTPETWELGGSFYFEGAQPLDEYRPTQVDDNGHETSYYYIENPEKIQRSDFDQDGLKVGSITRTASSDSWHTIGQDVSKSQFNYVEQFTLHANRAVTYIAPDKEDL